MNGLYAAQYVLIPSQMEYLSVYGIRTSERSHLTHLLTNYF
ncbi:MULTISPECIES: hypothetical protein [Aerosakkonema]